jgi:hypothetical protein
MILFLIFFETFAQYGAYFFFFVLSSLVLISFANTLMQV